MTFKKFFYDIFLEFSEKTIQILIKKFEKEAPEHVIRNYLDVFEKFKNNLEIKDPFRYNSFSDLERAVDAARAKSEYLKRNKKVDNNLDVAEAIIDDENVTIYKADDEHKCVKYGNGYSFCISRPAGGNMFSNYRLGHQSTFYFIFFKKKPKTDPQHIMVLDRTSRGWMWTFADNNTNNTTWEEVSEKFPELEKYKHVFVNIPLSYDETEIYQLMRKFWDNDIDVETFNNFPYNVKVALIRSGKTIEDNMFDILDSNLRNEYVSTGINLTEHQASNLIEKEIKRYLKIREQIIPHLLKDGVYVYNQLDSKIPPKKIKNEQGKIIFEGTPFFYSEFEYDDNENIFIKKTSGLNPEHVGKLQNKLYKCTEKYINDEISEIEIHIETEYDSRRFRISDIKNNLFKLMKLIREDEELSKLFLLAESRDITQLISAETYEDFRKEIDELYSSIHEDKIISTKSNEIRVYSHNNREIYDNFHNETYKYEEGNTFIRKTITDYRQNVFIKTDDYISDIIDGGQILHIKLYSAEEERTNIVLDVMFEDGEEISYREIRLSISKSGSVDFDTTIHEKLRLSDINIDKLITTIKSYLKEFQEKWIYQIPNSEENVPELLTKYRFMLPDNYEDHMKNDFFSDKI